ncbi:solute carrier organic anion transporter family member 1C1-like isoform X1 [Protopterus annectens]|uniref:solute carrier organic anion transporter family member 1C1-like isoform X1 n=1 Tax=Protopterus annectens TaxID=7888 RepID=UPI001CFB9951|nr:solute carrier organic anion transporter family member 1C1-like isoform X1 [Protopterus annectens]
MSLNSKSGEKNECSFKVQNLPSLKETLETPIRAKKHKYVCCENLKVFLLGLSFAYFSKALSGSYMKSVITQIERRFDISASAIGFIDGSFEIGNLLVIVFTSYFGAKLHRPKIIGIGCLVMAIGTIITAMPHFFMGRYKYESIVTLNNASSSLSPCLRSDNENDETKALREEPALEESDCTRTSGSFMWIIVFTGNLLRGIGEAPIVPLGMSYIDDFAKPENSGFYIACVQAVGIIGPVLGFLLGSLCARLYVDIGMVDLGTVTINPKDSRWVGAWWLGFLIAGTTSLLATFPFWFMPRSQMKAANKKHRLSELIVLTKEVQTGEKITEYKHGPTLSEIAKDFVPSLNVLLRSPIFILYLIISVISFNGFIGMITFKPKYIEQQFGQSASKANLLIGLTNIPALAMGILVSGAIMKKAKLSFIGIFRLAIWTSVTAFMFNLLFFIFTCENSKVAGLTVTYDGNSQVSYKEDTLNSFCNSDCKCSTKQWDPVCGENGITYASACLAGCQTSTGTGKNTVFLNCTCTLSAVLSVTGNSSAHLGQCPKHDDCSKMFIYYLASGIAGSFIAALSITPFSVILLRSVKPELKSFAIGIHTLCTRTLAGIPAPVYFGTLIDTTCLKWGTLPCGRRGACRVYDTKSFRFIFLGLMSALRAFGFLLYIPMYIVAKKEFNKSEKSDETDMVLGMMNVNDTDADVNEINSLDEEKQTKL